MKGKGGREKKKGKGRGEICTSNRIGGREKENEGSRKEGRRKGKGTNVREERDLR